MVENTNRALVPSRLGIPLQQLDMAFPSAKFAISWCWQVPCPSSSCGAAPCPPMGALCEIPVSGNMGLSGVQPALELVLGPQPPLVVQPTSTVSTLCSLAFFTGFCASSPCSHQLQASELRLGTACGGLCPPFRHEVLSGSAAKTSPDYAHPRNILVQVRRLSLLILITGGEESH